jgi:4-hydroxy-tetrahydrodipicolinate synthase
MRSMRSFKKDTLSPPRYHKYVPSAPQGVVTALVTPFRDDERIDFNAWQRIIDFQIEAGVAGLLAAGGQGEFFSLDEEERTVALRFCRQAVGGRAALYGNVGAVSTRETVRLAQCAQAEGVDYAVVVTPYYLRPSQDELVQHYADVCRAVHIPVLAYNIPERTGVDLDPASVRRIAELAENFIGLKDSSGRLDHIPELAQSAPGRPFSVFIGRDHLILGALERGAAGAVTACANVAPRAFVDLYRAFREGRTADAARLQELAKPLREAFALHTFPSVVKAAMEMIGLPAGPCRRPVAPMPAAARATLASVLEALRAAGYVPELAARQDKG